MTNSNRLRHSRSLALSLIIGLSAIACATTTPVELTNARVAYARASAGPAATLVPSDLHKAKVALDTAEQTFTQEENSQKTIDMAYIAERTAQIAEAHAQTAIAEKQDTKAKQDLGTKQGEIAKQTQGALVKTRGQLAAAERGEAEQAQQVGVERTAREEADKKTGVERTAREAADQRVGVAEQSAAVSDQKAKEANDALAKLAAKEDERGMVITLSGSVLFRSNDSVLLPAALSRLDEVASALVAKGQDVIVEGYTDSKGSPSSNMNLSRRRAESVRSYLVSRGVSTTKIVARGMGADRPIADNTSTEGRANNRRVEIVITRNSAMN
jgi:outer membrane protein OmpA-like peptidoglycan-associated protein